MAHLICALVRQRILSVVASVLGRPAVGAGRAPSKRCFPGRVWVSTFGFGAAAAVIACCMIGARVRRGSYSTLRLCAALVRLWRWVICIRNSGHASILLVGRCMPTGLTLLGWVLQYYRRAMLVAGRRLRIGRIGFGAKVPSSGRVCVFGSKGFCLGTRIWPALGLRVLSDRRV